MRTENGKRRTENGKLVVFQLGLLLVFFSFCHRNDPFIGRWTVEKVNVEFDENKSTPEMVRQYGEMERGNVIEISKDSVLTLISGGDTLRGRCSLQQHQLYCNGKLFGQLKDGIITTETTTPIGKIEVVYKK